MSGTEWVGPGNGDTVARLRVVVNRTEPWPDRLLNKKTELRLTGWALNTYDREERIPEALRRICAMCVETGIRPSHDGSPRCQSGSIASGGRNDHCTCDTCF
jgi:hypothetical protein